MSSSIKQDRFFSAMWHSSVLLKLKVFRFDIVTIGRVAPRRHFGPAEEETNERKKQANTGSVIYKA